MSERATTEPRPDDGPDDAGRPRSWRPSVVTLVTALVVANFVLPARQVVGAIGAAGRPTMLLGLGLMVVWGLFFLTPSDRRRLQPVRWMVGAYVAVWFASLVVAYQRGLTGVESAGIERFLLLTMSIVGVALLVADRLPDRDALDTVLRRVVYCGAFMGVLGLVQFFLRIAPVQSIDYPFLSQVDGQFIGLGTRGGAGLVRAVSTTSHSIEFGVISAMILPLAIHFALAAPPGGRRIPWLLVALAGVGVPFSLARSGIIAVVLAVIVLLRAFNRRSQRLSLAVIAVTVLALRGAVPGLVGTFVSFFSNTGNDNSVEGRTDDYPIVLELIGDRPLLGLGGGTFRPEEYFFLDNYILNVTVSTGLLGLATLLVLFFGTYTLGIRIFRRARSHEDRSLAVAIAASVMAGFGASFTFDSLNFPTFATTFFLLIGSMGALWRLRDTRFVVEREERYGAVLKDHDRARPLIRRAIGEDPVEPPDPAPAPTVAPAPTGSPGRSRSFVHGLSWSMVMNVGQQVGTLAVTFVLAGLLGPRTFGIVAIASVFLAFVQLVVQQGMGAAIIQRDSLDRRDLDTAFWLLGATSVVMALLVVGLRGWWADLNDLPELDGVLLALAPLVLFRGLLIVPDSLLRRDMNFRPLALRTNLSVVVGGVVGVGGALAGWGVWALVAQQLVAGVVELVVVWSAAAWRPGFSWSRSSARSLLGFTGPSMLGSVGIFAQTRIDAAIAGIFFGPTAVGIYRFGARLVDTASRSVIATFRSVALPDLAPLKQDMENFRLRLIEVIGLAGAAAALVLAALAAAAPGLIELVGPEWESAIPVVLILSVAGMVRTVASLNGPVLQALGRPGLLAALSWIGAVASSSMLVAVGVGFAGSGTNDQVIALAAATLAFEAVVVLSLTIWAFRQVVGVSPRTLLGSVWPAVLAGLAGFVVAAGADRAVLESVTPLVRVALVGGASVAVSALVYVRLRPDLRSTFSRLLAPSTPAQPAAV
ncbi:MAG: oligosaccharide flippase family protein [Actinomycetota bacterium]